MGILKRLFGERASVAPSDLSEGAQAFLDGRKDTLTSSDIDPDGAEKYDGYERAMALKRAGKLSEAAEILARSVSPPSIYKGHYSELFKIWRQLNREDVKASRYEAVVERVLTMIRLDDEMIAEMLRYWSIQQGRQLPLDYFDKDRNLRVSDAKALRTAATALGRDDTLHQATALVDRFSTKHT